MQKSNIIVLSISYLFLSILLPQNIDAITSVSTCYDNTDNYPTVTTKACQGTTDNVCVRHVYFKASVGNVVRLYCASLSSLSTVPQFTGTAAATYNYAQNTDTAVFLNACNGNFCNSSITTIGSSSKFILIISILLGSYLSFK